MLAILEMFDGIPEAIDVYADEEEGFRAFDARLNLSSNMVPLSDEEKNYPYWDNGYGKRATADDGFATDGKMELRIMPISYYE